MTKVLILGGTGKLGKVIISYLLLKNNFKLVALVRNPSKLNIENENLKIVKGSINNSDDLEKVLVGVDLVISVLGHGFRTKYSVLEISLKNLIPLMEKRNIKKFITVTGAALKTKKDTDSFMLKFTEKAFGLIDPYRINDAKNQYKILEKSNLNWIVVRTPIHKNGSRVKLKHVGYIQPMPWDRVSRISIAQFIFECICKNKYSREAPIIF